MKYSFTVEVDTENSSPCVVGEFLRDKFWDQSKGYGCYGSFDYNNDVIELSSFKEKHNSYELEWQRAKWNDIECSWFWDGDGTIEFIFPDGSKLVNPDCKKDYEWEWIRP